MQKIKVISKKYDGTLRDEYETYLYAETDETITLFSLPGTKFWQHRKAVESKAPDGLLEIYFKHRWYNVRHIGEQISGWNLSYVNLAMPATFNNGVLEWVDLDLDYRYHLDHTLEQLDQVDFEKNTQQMGYPSDMLEQVEIACQEIETGFAQQTYPFDHDNQVELYRHIKANLMSSG